jgi:hypothetical protein
MLKEYYLRSQVYGHMAEFNKQYFPQDWESMRQELEIMIDKKPNGENQ